MKRLVMLFLFGLASLSQAFADGIPDPSGEVVLYVHGDIDITNAPGPAAMFDMAMLESLGMHEVITSTPFTDGVTTFRGPLLRDVLNAVEAWGTNISARALDDYASEFPVSDARDHDFILAISDDRGLLATEQFGPIWIVGPMDADPVIGEEAMHNRWVWNLNWLEIN